MTRAQLLTRLGFALAVACLAGGAAAVLAPVVALQVWAAGGVGAWWWSGKIG